MDHKKIIAIMEREMQVTRGCTEPSAVAFTAAKAAEATDPVERIEVKASVNIIKNAMSVRIPGADGCGVGLAAALGAVRRDSSRRLDIFSGLDAETVGRAKRLVGAGNVTVGVSDSPKKLYIDVTVFSGKTRARAVTEDEHTNVTLVEKDGKVLFTGNELQALDEKEDGLDLNTVWSFTKEARRDELSIVQRSIELNSTISLEGIQNVYGLRVGKTIYDRIKDEPDKNKVLADYAAAVTAAGSDARMAGCELSVVGNSGSGNQGITASMPVVAVAHVLKIGGDRLLRAVTLSQLVTIMIKSGFGRLSALCGATIAATGASCGIVYLYGGGLKEVRSAIQNTLGNVTGMLCDGAKAGCALKVSTCTSAAIQAALLAMRGITISHTDGIIGSTAENTIGNVCRIANSGTQGADKIMLSIMLNKKA